MEDGQFDFLSESESKSFILVEGIYRIKPQVY